MSEAELIDRAGAGDPRAIRKLHDRHAPLVLTVARRITGDEDAARDCAQEVWIRALRSLHTFEGRAPFSAWIRRIAARVAVQSDRSDRRRSRREALFSGREEHISHPAELPDGDRLEMALLDLPEGMRRVLLLHDVEGFTHEEIGEVLDIAPGTSKSQLFKARAKLRRMLRESRGSKVHEVRTAWKAGKSAIVADEVGRSERKVAAESRGFEQGGMRGWST